MPKRIRKDLYLDEESLIYLKIFPGDFSGHIRRAIDDYIEKIKKDGVSVSPTEKGVKNQNT